MAANVATWNVTHRELGSGMLLKLNMEMLTLLWITSRYYVKKNLTSEKYDYYFPELVVLQNLRKSVCNKSVVRPG